MTNLPIISTPQKLSGNAANVAQTNNMADSQPAEASWPFAALLARQIDGADFLSANVAPGAIATDSAAQPLKNKQEEAAIPSGAPGDQANTLAAMLLQLPQETHTPLANDAASTSTAPKKVAGIDVSARQPVLLSDAKPDMENIALGRTDAAAIAADKRIIADAVSQDMVKRVELGVSQNPPGTNAAQLPASSTIPAMMPNMLDNNRLVDTAQTIATPLGDSNWADDFSQKISWMSTQKNQIAELHLNPPDLGPLNIVLKISENQATAMFTSPHSAVREAVENAIPRLREILADNGITLGNTTVSDQSARDRSTEGSLHQGSGDQGPGTAAQRVEFKDASGASPDSARTLPARRHNGMVDTFA